MEQIEYEKLAAVEKNHWFYSGKREIVRYWFRKLIPASENLRHLDAGAGTGILVEELSGSCFSAGVEPSACGLSAARRIPMIKATVNNLPFRDNTFDCVTAMDVLEHVEDDRNALLELVRVARKNGFIFINVPAFMMLWGPWDESLHHKRRYTISSFKKITDVSRAEITDMFYCNSVLFLPILAYRLFCRLFPALFKKRLEDVLPNRLLNRILRFIYVYPATFLRLHAPFGLSLFIILRKI